MSDCCGTTESSSCSTTRSRRHRCPVNGKTYPEVEGRTLLHHLRTPWQIALTEQPYYYCDDPGCPVVYFGADDTTITQESLRTSVGCKIPDDEATVCYCFGVTRAEARNDPAARTFVVEQTRIGACACDTRNPSGRCCLKDFPRPG